MNVSVHRLRKIEIFSAFVSLCWYIFDSIETFVLLQQAHVRSLSTGKCVHVSVGKYPYTCMSLALIK